MTLFRIILNNARQRWLSTLLTSLGVAMGAGLVIAILSIKSIAQERLRLGYSGFDLVVGAKGSPLQLVLNVVYNLDTSPGNISYSVYENLAKDPRVKLAVPFAVGDNYQGFRIVGTTDRFLKEFQPRPNESFQLATGRVFTFNEAELLEAMKEAMERSRESHVPPSTPGAKPGKKEKSHEEHHDHAHHDHHEHEGHEPVREAVLGSFVAQETGLKAGDTFVAAHGLQAESEDLHKESPWTVVGILKPTGTPSDRAIYINLDSFYHIEGHVIEEKATDEKKKEPEAGQISSLALKLKSPVAVFSLRKQLNNSPDCQGTVPAEEIRKLLSIVGNVDRILLAQAILIVVVSALGMALAIYNSMNERRRDIAIMRALGAHRGTIVLVIIGEAALISFLGAAMGVLLGHGVIWMASPAVEAAVGFGIPAWSFHWFELQVFVGVMMMGVFSGIGPALAAYRTDVATNLTTS